MELDTKIFEKTKRKISPYQMIVNLSREKGIEAALRATSFFFGGKIEKVNDQEVDSIFADVPSVDLKRSDLEAGLPILDLLAETPLFKSKGEARRSVTQKGVYLNNN